MRKNRLLILIGIIFLSVVLGLFLTQRQATTLEVNVKDYGAIGDGVVDDTSAFQVAINAVKQKGGGTVFVPTGTYSLKPIFLKGNVHLRGENRDKSILKLADDADDDYTRLITTANNTSIQSLTIDGNYQAHPDGIEHMHCIFVYDHENVLIKNNVIINAVGDGISVSGSSKTSKNIIITNNVVEENQRSQIVIEQVNDLRVKNNVMRSKTGRPGLHFEPWEKQQFKDAQISGNTIESNVEGNCVLLAGADSELAGKGESGYFFQNIEFKQNQVNCPRGALLLMDTKNAKVSGNELRISEIHVWRKNQQLSIEGNTINAINGIRLEGGMEGKLISTGTKISGNRVHSTNDGVNIHAGASNTIITDNTFIGTKQASGVAIFASDNIIDTVISKNSFQHYRFGVYLDYDYYSDTEIVGVNISDNKFAGENSAIMQTIENSHRLKDLVISKNHFN